MVLTDGQKHVIELVDEFCDEHFDEPSIKQWCMSRGLPMHVYDAFYESELGSYVLPTSVGGKDCSFLDRTTLIMAMVRRAGASLPFQSDATALALLSSMRQISQDEIIEELYSKTGRVLFSQAFTEPNAGTDTQAVRTQVTTDGGDIYLDGVKTFVSSGEFASNTLVLARDPVFGQLDGGMSLWLVPVQREGVSSRPLNTIGQEMLASAALTFDHVKLDPNWQIQTEGKLDSMLKRQFGLGRVLVCASSAGLALAALDDAVAHASEHTVKGRQLVSLPQIQEKLADMEAKVRSIMALTFEAARTVDGNSRDFDLDTALAKRYVPAMATEVASGALQVFGGIGYTDQTRVSRIWQDCRGNQIAWGTDEVMAGIVAKSIVRKAGSRRW
ncbi:MAG: acyl-CoA dehydrogenase family protein [Eggerthellaceae bacterium]|nr:acyl-CoA dehydrogenase family protein [Eggerthellaceae bacterium]